MSRNDGDDDDGGGDDDVITVTLCIEGRKDIYKFVIISCEISLHNYLYNRSQQDEVFLNFILIYNSTCFGQT
jgi:hypothetical protein